MDFAKLKESVEWSIMQLGTPRKNRLDAVKQLVGSHYTDNGSEKVVPINFIELATTIYVRLLAARTPRCMVTSKAWELRPYAADLEEIINHIPDRIDLGTTIRLSVLNAMFSLAAVKIGISDSGKKVEGEPYLEPFVDPILFDNYFLDMTAKNSRDIQFEGNDYWITRSEVKRIFGKSMDPDEETTVDDNGNEMTKSVETNNEDGKVPDPRLWLRDVYDHSRRVMYTYSVKNGTVLREIPWDGPEEGPYIRLAFNDVPGNLLPLPPVSLWQDLHELANTLFRKVSRQADVKKTVVAFPGGNDPDVQALKNASDGDGIKYTGAKPEMLTVGGIDQPTLALIVQLRDLFSYFGGNLDSLGGLSPQSDTATQDQLISNAAGARIGAMRDAVIKFTDEIFRQLAWYVWTDPVRKETIIKSVPGFPSFQIKKEWTPETRRGDFIDYNFEVTAFSMEDNSPSLKLQKMSNVLQQFFVPFLQLMVEQGIYVDMMSLAKFISKNSNLPELDEIIKSGGPREQSNIFGSPNPSFKPPTTRRIYERVNRPGATRHGSDSALVQMLLGGNPQKSERDAIGRGVS